MLNEEDSVGVGRRCIFLLEMPKMNLNSFKNNRKKDLVLVASLRATNSQRGVKVYQGFT